MVMELSPKKRIMVKIKCRCMAEDEYKEEVGKKKRAVV
jgi:hypothetical protein